MYKSEHFNEEDAEFKNKLTSLVIALASIGLVIYFIFSTLLNAANNEENSRQVSRAVSALRQYDIHVVEPKLISVHGLIELNPSQRGLYIISAQKLTDQYGKVHHNPRNIRIERVTSYGDFRIRVDNTDLIRVHAQGYRLYDE